MPFDRNPIIFFNCKKWLSKADELAYVFYNSYSYMTYVLDFARLVGWLLEFLWARHFCIPLCLHPPK
jgi:hypothetical protein